MTHNFKPGDVAMVACDDLYCGRPEHPAIYASIDKWWVLDDGTYSDSVRPLRPLVVIDPESAEQVERLAKGLPGSWNLFQPDDPELGEETVAAFQAALREFATPTPPKPDEPQGLGAVVEDANMRRWTRAIVGPDDLDPWYREDILWGGWADIDAVRVLSEGVTS